MKRVKRWRYYCDHCKKSGGSGGAMAKHEKHCTMNPERSCRMCDVANGNQAPIKELIAAVGHGRKEGLENVRTAAEGCPACILAAIRQSKINEIADENGIVPGYVEFDFKQEKAEFWASINNEQYREYY